MRGEHAHRFALCAALAAFAAACSSGFKSTEPPVQSYLLRAARVDAPTAALGQTVLQVERPTAAPGLDTDRILLLRSGNRFDTYAASRWVDNAPAMLESLIVETLQGSGEYRAVFGDTPAFPPDVQLRVSLRRFEADYSAGGAPTIHVAFDAAIGRRDGRELLAAFSIGKSVRASEDRMSAVVSAFETASQAAITELAGTLRATLQKVDSPDASIKR